MKKLLIWMLEKWSLSCMLLGFTESSEWIEKWIKKLTEKD